MSQTREAPLSDRAPLTPWSFGLLTAGGFVAWSGFDSGERGWLLVAAIALGVLIQAIGVYVASGASMRREALRYSPIYMVGLPILNAVEDVMERPWWQEIPVAIAALAAVAWLWESATRWLERMIRRRFRA